MRRRLSARTCRDDGQSFAILLITVTGLLVMSGFVFDIGYAFVADRKAQAAADASALGAALVLPNRTEASKAADELAHANFTLGTVTLTFESTDAADDTVTAHARASVGTIFSRVVGVDVIDVGASATARIGSYTGYAKSLAPWVTDRNSLVWGSELTFKVKPGDQASSGNFGSVRLPLKSKGCGFGNGTNDYRKVIENLDSSCLVENGDTIETEPGNMGAVTGQALKDRGTINNFDPYTLLAFTGGQYQLTVAEHPNLVVIPIVESFGGGSASVLVTGFAWFIITRYDKDSVQGIFVRSGLPGGAICPTATDPNAGCPMGAYDPDGFRVVQLTR